MEIFKKEKMICPKCKSEKITLYMGGQFGKYECKDCEYIGPLIIEEYKKVKKKPIRVGVPYWSSFILDNLLRKLFTNRMEIVKNANIKKGHIILEVGCGPGFFTEVISDVIGGKGRVYALDVQEQMIEKIKKKIENGKIRKNAHTMVSNASKINLPSNSVDVVFVTYAFEELNKKEKSIEEFYRICKHKGHLTFREHKFLVKKPEIKEWLNIFIDKGFKLVSKGETFFSYYAEFKKFKRK